MSHVPCYMNEDGTPACCTDSESRIAELEARIAELEGALAEAKGAIELGRAALLVTADLKAEVARLRCCATCEYESDPEWLDGAPYCQQHDLMQVGYHDPCHFKPSRWAERGTE